MTARTKVLVAMSGGVDSSVAAALLLEQGYDVIGVTMQIWPRSGAEHRSGCCSLDAVEDARRVADLLGIPYYVLNMRDVFAATVIDYFCDEYLHGRTPNPCIACNRYVKFDALMKKADALEADYVATGHYARIERLGERWVLKRGLDRAKDQSYVLYPLTQQQMKRVLFPLGEYTKEKTREKARALGLRTAEKPESQEICFVPNDDYGEFLKSRRPGEIMKGPILDEQGNRLGTHGGVAHFTIGQRRGIGISSPYPLYVLRIEPNRNAIIVGPRESLYRSALICEDLNWISVEGIDAPMRVHAKIRYTAPEAPATLFPCGRDEVRVEFDEPQFAITPGQAAVFYHGDTVVGGGTISCSQGDPAGSH
ncbi:MAG: tRNA 2-thiouridine(34) synthase MnmA [Bacillota bacterium]